MTRRILSTALVSAAAFAAVLGIPATADDPTATPTASSSPCRGGNGPAGRHARPGPHAGSDRGPHAGARGRDADGPARRDGHRGARGDRDSLSPRPSRRRSRRPPRAPRRPPRPPRRPRRPPTPRRSAPRSAPPTARRPQNGQARACTEKDTGKASTSTSTSGCVEVESRSMSPRPCCAESHKRRRQPRPVEPELLARDSGSREDRRAELLHRQVPDSSVPAPDLPGRRHAVRHPLGDPRGHQRDRDRLRPQPQRLLRRRAGLDAVHARHVEGLRRRRQPRRRQGPVQPGRRDLRRRALPEGRGRRQRHPQGHLRLQPRRLVRRLGADARPGHRRHPRRPRGLAHRPHPGPLPGPRQGDLRRRAQEGRPHDQGRQRRRRRRVRRDPPQHRDLRQGRLARDRRQRRQGAQARRQQAPRPLRDRAGRLRQHLHVRAPEDRRQDLPVAEEAHPHREGQDLQAPWPRARVQGRRQGRRHAAGRDEDRGDRRAAAAPVAKVRLFANPTRKNARKAGGDAQVAGGETASAGAPLGLDPDDFVAKPLARAPASSAARRSAASARPPDQGPAPAVRDPPGRPRRPAHRPEADPRRLEAARVDRGLPRQGQERAVRLRRRRAHHRPDHADEQGDARPPRARRPPDQDLRLRRAPTSAPARSTAACSRRSPTSPPRA